ncbi:MAG: DUF1385 domain-containing protein [Bacillota bacterium]
MEKVYMGGQAVIEGVVMQSPTATALAVRVPDGSIHVEDFEHIKPPPKRNWRNWPMLRGVWRMWKMLSVGMRSINRSAALAFPGETDQNTGGAWATVLAVIIALAVFIALPTVAAGTMAPLFQNPYLLNIAEGIVRLALFLAYLWAVSRIRDIRRVFMYHGAEHKVVHCYERGLELNVENASVCPRLHPRCGTSYLLLIVVLSIVLFSLLGWSGAWYVRIGTRLLMLPVVTGLAYELLRVAARHESLVWRAIRFPGVQLQRLTTREPESGMIEVAIAAFNRAARTEEREF